MYIHMYIYIYIYTHANVWIMNRVSLSFMTDFGFYETGFWLFPGVLEGLGSSGKLEGTIFTHPGTYKCPGSRVIAKNPPGGILFYQVPCLALVHQVFLNVLASYRCRLPVAHLPFFWQFLFPHNRPAVCNPSVLSVHLRSDCAGTPQKLYLTCL